MEFRLSDDQTLLQASLSKLLKRELSRELPNTSNPDPAGNEQLWTALTELGVPSLAIPERFDGLGGTCLDFTIVSEALGAVAASVPSLGSVLGAVIINMLADEAQAARINAKIAAGSMRIAVACREAGGATKLALNGGQTTGSLSAVVELPAATHVLIVLEDNRCILCDLGDPSISVQSTESFDRTRPLGAANLSASPFEQLGDRALSSAEMERFTDHGRLIMAAEMFGAASEMFDQALAYVKMRVQFKRPIGSFQAIKHICAEMATALEPCRSLLWYAAHSYDLDDEKRRVNVCHAKAHIGDVARRVAQLSIHLHGAIGITNELPLQLLFKRIGANRYMFGDPTQCRVEAAQAQGWAL